MPLGSSAPDSSWPVERVEAQLAKEQGRRREREYDEKFHILQAPDLFLPDLSRARTSGSLRGINVAVAFIDIDKFKDFNTEHGEPTVHRSVLPKFMRHIEAHVYRRGYAYRFGGDEYAVLLENVADGEAVRSMDLLRRGLGELTYDGTTRSTTVSVGVVVVGPDCHLTGSDVLNAAARAKNFAKSKGRNCVATYTAGSFDESALVIDEAAS